MNQLTISGIITNSISLGLKNVASLVGAVILWALTIWIPYLNVGTTIALFGGFIVEMGKGKVLSPLEIFNPNYRKHMGEVFLLWGFMLFGINAGMIFLIIPAIVISIAWGLSLPLLIEKELTPLEAIKTSNELTYGKKWTIFFGTFAVAIGGAIVIGILFWIFSKVNIFLAAFIGFVGYLALISTVIAVNAYIYSVLTQGKSE